MLLYILIQLISFPWGDYEWCFIKFEVQETIFFPFYACPSQDTKYLLKGFVIVTRSILFLNLTDYFHLWINHKQHSLFSCLCLFTGKQVSVRTGFGVVVDLIRWKLSAVLMLISPSFNYHHIRLHRETEQLHYWYVAAVCQFANTKDSNYRFSYAKIHKKGKTSVRQTRADPE